MALFDFFSRLSFFKGRDTAGMTDDDLDFAKWNQVHQQWRNRLSAYISGASQEDLNEHHVCLDDRCDLGRWIYGHGRRYYGDLPVFNQLRCHHADFHRSAGNVVALYKTKGAAAAQKALHEEFDLHSLRVVRGLEGLERHVKA
jgi:hypothetical protein